MVVPRTHPSAANSTAALVFHEVSAHFGQAIDRLRLHVVIAVEAPTQATYPRAGHGIGKQQTLRYSHRRKGLLVRSTEPLATTCLSAAGIRGW